MSRITRLAAALLVLLASARLAPAAPAPDGANSALALVPATAPIVIYVRGVEATKDRLIATIKKSLPEHADLVEGYLNKTWTDGTPDGRKLRGLAKKGPVFAVFTEMPKPPDEPKLAVVVAVTSYKEFRDNILTEEERKEIKSEGGYDSAAVAGQTLYFIDKKEYAVVTPDKDVAKSFTKKQKGLDDLISREQAAKLLGGDVGVYVSMDAMNKEYADQLKAAKESAHEGSKRSARLSRKTSAARSRCCRRSSTPPSRPSRTARACCSPSNSARAVSPSTCRPSSGPAARRPRRWRGASCRRSRGWPGCRRASSFYVGMESNKWITAVANNMTFGAGTEADSKEGKALQAAINELVAADPGTVLSAYSLPMRGVQVSHFADPAKAFEAQMKLLRALGSGTAYSGGYLKDKPKITPKAEKYKDIELTNIEVKWDFEKVAAGGARRCGAAG